MELFGILDHTVMTTSSHRYIRHRSELWSDAKKIDFLVDMFSEAGEAWMLAAMTRPGAEHITTVAAAGEYLSTHVPEDGPVGDSGAVHALTRGRRGWHVQCFGCEETGHVVANCPHRAQGTSALGATLTYNRSSAPHQHTDTSAQDMGDTCGNDKVCTAPAARSAAAASGIQAQTKSTPSHRRSSFWVLASMRRSAAESSSKRRVTSQSYGRP